MALIHVNFMAASLNRTADLVVCLPTDKSYGPFQTEHRDPNKPFKTLYLLNGILGSEVDWVSGTRIQRWSDDRNLAVVMPAGENSYYVDHPWTGQLFSQFIGHDLVEFTRRTFPLSVKREDTFIGGLSMGGYGALYNGLKFNDTFSAIVMLSAGLTIRPGMEKPNPHPTWFAETPEYLHSVFGPDLAAAVNSEMNPKVLVEHQLAAKIQFPAIYMAIGTEDQLKGFNDDFDQFLTVKEVAHTYETGPGAHEWDFWDHYLLRALDWLPLESKEQGIGSGNIK